MPRKPTERNPTSASRGTAYLSTKNPEKVTVKNKFNPQTMERVQIAPGTWIERIKKA